MKRPAFQNQEGSHIHITVNLTKTDGQNPPYDHNFLLGSAVYDLLRRDSKEASAILHDAPGRSAYVLSEIHGVRGKKGEFWFRVGTSSEAVGRLVGKALTPSTGITVGPTSFQVTGLAIEEPVVRPGEFVTLSPILLRDENGKSLVHDSEGYGERLEEAMNRQIMNNTGREGNVRLVHFEAQAVRKRKIRDRTFLAQKGRLLLDGPEEDLRFLVEHGIGRSPAMGFGMVVLNKRRLGLHFKVQGNNTQAVNVNRHDEGGQE